MIYNVLVVLLDMNDPVYDKILQGMKAMSEGNNIQALDIYNDVLGMITEGKVKEYKTEVKYITIVTIETVKLFLEDLMIGSALKHLINTRKIILNAMELESKGLIMKENYEKLQEKKNIRDTELENFIAQFHKKNLEMYFSLYMFISIYILECLLHTKNYEEICKLKKDIDDVYDSIDHTYLYTTDDFLPYTSSMIEDIIAHYHEIESDAELACKKAGIE